MKVLDGRYFRPILGLSKQQIEEYLTRRGLEWREDASNQSRAYKRNKVRLDLLPLMAELAGGKAALSARFAQMAQQSEDLQSWMDFEVILHEIVSFVCWITFSCSAQCQQYNKEIEYDSAARDNTYLAKMSFRYPDQAATVPKLVLGELVRKWVVRCCDVELAADRVQALVDLARTPLPHGRASRSVTISKIWDVVRVRHELQLRPRVVPERHQHRT